MTQHSLRKTFWRTLRSTALLAAAVLTSACDGHNPTTPRIDPWEPGQLQLSMMSGNNQVGVAGRPLEAPFMVRVVDRYGGTVSGAVVLWDIVEGEGELPAVPKAPPKIYYETKTDAVGIGSVVLTLGARPGRNVVEARVMFGSGSATFVARATAN